MFCEECGKQIPDNSKFCDGCGAPVKPVEMQGYEPYRDPSFQQPYQNLEYGGREKKKKGNAQTIAIIILSIVALILIGVLVFLGIRTFGEKKKGGSDGNVVAEETGRSENDPEETEEIHSEEESETKLPETESFVPETPASPETVSQPETSVPVVTEVTSEYILPTSDSAYLTEADIAVLSKEELRLARNEIYARHGRKFKDDSLNEYFKSKSWYVPLIDPDHFNENVFNDYEVANRKLIADYEKKMGY